MSTAVSGVALAHDEVRACRPLPLPAPFQATKDTILYPLGAAGAHRASLGRGAVMGLLNLLWGVAATIGPLASGAAAEAAGERWTFGLLVACCAVTGAWMLSAQRPSRPSGTSSSRRRRSRRRSGAGAEELGGRRPRVVLKAAHPPQETESVRYVTSTTLSSATTFALSRALPT